MHSNKQTSISWGLLERRKRVRSALSFDLLFYVSVWQMLWGCICCICLAADERLTRWLADCFTVSLSDSTGLAQLWLWHFKANSREVHFKTRKRHKRQQPRDKRRAETRRDLSTRYMSICCTWTWTIQSDRAMRPKGQMQTTWLGLRSVPTICPSLCLYLSIPLDSPCVCVPVCLCEKWIYVARLQQLMLKNDGNDKVITLRKRLENWGTQTQVREQSKLKLKGRDPKQIQFSISQILNS